MIEKMRFSLVLPVVLVTSVCGPAPSAAQLSQIVSAQRTIALNEECRAEGRRLSIPSDQVSTFVTGCVVGRSKLDTQTETGTDSGQ